MLDEIGEFSHVDDWIERHLGDGEDLMGFGHRVYRMCGPRADALKDMVNRVQNTRPRMALAETAEKAAMEALKVRHLNRNLETSVELITAILLEGTGLPRDLFAPVFATGRVLGWTAHIYEKVTSSFLIWRRRAMQVRYP